MKDMPLLSTLNKIDCKLLELTISSLSQTVLYDNRLFDKGKNTHFYRTIEYFIHIFIRSYLVYIVILFYRKDSKSPLFGKFSLES